MEGRTQAEVLAERLDEGPAALVILSSGAPAEASLAATLPAAGVSGPDIISWGPLESAGFLSLAASRL